MISERKLVASSSSFWRQAMPMGDAFVRSVNENLMRFEACLSVVSDQGRNSLISELSFRLFCEYRDVNANVDLARIDAARLESLAKATEGFISRLEKGKAVREMTAVECKDALLLATKVGDHFARFESGSVIVTRPQFVGCGILDDCEGDVLAGSTLYEIKNVDRDFRLADFRQLLVYAALNYAAKTHPIDSVALVNVRLGKRFRIGLDEFASSVAAVSQFELLNSIVSYVSSERLSN
jgi:hypothetical protein